ncbi:MAG: hypothetical protein L0312_17545, partial [Acidobacteria bacterium]|nr:hypothetical protein [Acidobacteriota bacterium]
FGIQRDVGFNMVFDLAYVASRGVHLSRTFPINQPVLARAPEVVINRVPLQQVRPYPVYSGFNAVFYDATSNYHSFQLKGTRRFSSGFSLDGNYTFSKNMDTFSNQTDSMQIPWQFAAIERGLSSLDRTHIFTIGSVYELPFGRNKRFLNGSPVLSAILGGFQLNTLFSTSSGLPLTIRQRNSNEILSAQRPDTVAGGDPSGRLEEPVFVGASRRWLIARTDPAFPFRPSSNLGIGNLGRNTSREPGYVNFNLSLFRQFRIKEGFNAEFRLEAFNAFNHVNFLEPASTNIDDANYGLITAAAPARQIQLGLRLSF